MSAKAIVRVVRTPLSCWPVLGVGSSRTTDFHVLDVSATCDRAEREVLLAVATVVCGSEPFGQGVLEVKWPGASSQRFGDEVVRRSMATLEEIEAEAPYETPAYVVPSTFDARQFRRAGRLGEATQLIWRMERSLMPQGSWTVFVVPAAAIDVAVLLRDMIAAESEQNQESQIPNFARLLPVMTHHRALLLRSVGVVAEQYQLMGAPDVVAELAKAIADALGTTVICTE